MILSPICTTFPKLDFFSPLGQQAGARERRTSKHHGGGKSFGSCFFNPLTCCLQGHNLRAKRKREKMETIKRFQEILRVVLERGKREGENGSKQEKKTLMQQTYYPCPSRHFEFHASFPLFSTMPGNNRIWRTIKPSHRRTDRATRRNKATTAAARTTTMTSFQPPALQRRPLRLWRRRRH